MSSSPERHAKKHLLSAYKSLKTKPWMFRFSPRYEEAAIEFHDAGKAFQSIGLYEQAISAFEKCAEVQDYKMCSLTSFFPDLWDFPRFYEHYVASVCSQKGCRITHLEPVGLMKM